MRGERFYRQWVKADGLVTFQVTAGETDLAISCETDLRGQAAEFILHYRGEITRYAEGNPDFYRSLTPLAPRAGAPAIVRMMCAAARKAGVGPMAAVAGAVAECVGRDLMRLSGEVIVENGGDLFIKSRKERRVGIFAGASPLSGKVVIGVGPAEKGTGVCTSSGTVGHSLSFGKADAALIVADDTALADAVATATGNLVVSAADIGKGIDFARGIDGVRGVVIIIGEKMGSWGEVRFV